jgi:hypothetical protein
MLILGVLVLKGRGFKPRPKSLRMNTGFSRCGGRRNEFFSTVFSP